MSEAYGELIEIAHRGLITGTLPWIEHDPEGDRLEVEGLVLVRQRWPGPSSNFVAAVNSGIPDLDGIIQLARQFYGPEHAGWGVLVQGDAGHPLEAELRDTGWEVAEDEPAYVLPGLDMWEAPLGGDELTWTLAASEAELLEQQVLLHRVFVGDAPMEEEPRTPASVLLDRRLFSVLGRRDGEAVTSAAGFLVDDTVHVAGVGTLPEHRGMGFGGAATRRVIQEGKARGAQAAVLRSGPLSRPLYERLGFQYACQHRTYAPP